MPLRMRLRPLLPTTFEGGGSCPRTRQSNSFARWSDPYADFGVHRVQEKKYQFLLGLYTGGPSL